MFKRMRAGYLAILASILVAFSLSACAGGGGEGRDFALVGEEQEIQGTVVGTKLTLCGPVPDQPGTCEGHLLVQTERAAEPVQIEVTRDVVLRKAGQAVFLPQFDGSVVRATYRTAETGEKVATSVEAES